ncbi:MAG: transaldolase [Meiothermus sp.]
MRLYLDSADVKALEPLLQTGVFYGITTNPTVLRTARVRPREFVSFADWAFGKGAKELYFQAWGGTPESLYSRGKTLARISTKVVVKLPATQPGLEAASKLSAEGVRTCITAVYAPFQALLAASSGAAYVAPYLGRMNDAGRDGHGSIAQMARALGAVGSATEILAASVRRGEDVAILAENGVCCITLSPAVAGTLFQEPLTLEATQAFENAAKELEA